MTKSIDVTINLDGQKYTGKINDTDALLFMSAIFDDNENAALKLGRLKEAGASYQKRADDRLKELRAQGISEEEALNEWALYLLNRVNLSWMIQDLIAWRITKRFKDIPSSLVSWSREEGGDIFLGVVELLQLLTALIAPALKIMGETTYPGQGIETDKEIESPDSVETYTTAVAVESVPEKEEVLPQSEESLPVPVAVPVVIEPNTSELDAEIAQIEIMLEQRKRQRQEQQSIALETAIAKQR